MINFVENMKPFIYRRHFYFILTLFFFVACSEISFADSFNGQIVRAFFTSKINNNKPVNEVLILENTVSEVYFYSEVKGMKGESVTHTWEHRGEKVYQKKFDIQGESQKLISSYKLSPARTGEWMVLVSNKEGIPIKAVMFKYVKKGSFAGKGIVTVK